MSASSKKKLRKEQEAAKMTEQQIAAQKEAKKLNLYTAIFVAVLVALLVIAIAVGVNKTLANSGIREKNTTALEVGSHQISNAELNYFYMDTINQFYSQYGSYAMLFGLDTSLPLDQQVMDEETGLTWADDFLSSAKDSAKAAYALADAAEAQGFTLTEEQLTAIETSVNNLDAYAKLYGYPDADAYLKAMYGAGSTKESFLKYNKLVALANALQVDHAKNLTYTDEDLRAVDAENFNKYSSFSYNIYYLAASRFLEGGTEDENGTVTYSDEEKAASAKACEAVANTLTAEEIDSVEAFDQAIAALEVNAEVTTAASTAKTNTLYTSVDTNYVDWVADETRKAGDKDVFVNSSTDSEGNVTINGYTVVFYQGSNDNTFKLPNVRHILLAFEGGTKDENTGMTVYSDEEKAVAKAAAEEILAQWKAGEATEDSFAALANEKSADGNGTTGGLYENVRPGQMVASFNDWCFEAGRKAGDTDIIETQYGYHVMYFVGEGTYTFRDYMIEDELRSAATSEWYNETVDAVTMTDGNTKYIRTDLVLGGAK